MTETKSDGIVPASIVPVSLGTLLDVVLDDTQAAGGRTRPPALLAAAVACALATAVLMGSVGISRVDDAPAVVAAASR